MPAQRISVRHVPARLQDLLRKSFVPDRARQPEPAQAHGQGRERALVNRVASQAGACEATSPASSRTIASKLLFTGSSARAISETKAASGQPSSISRQCFRLR